MNIRWFPKNIRKRLLASVLTVTLLMPNTGMSIFASSVNDNEKTKQYNPYIVEALQKLCPEGENVIGILDDLKEKGIIDEEGMPIDAEFDVEGKKMSVDELTLEAKKHKTGSVKVDGIDTTWEELNQIVNIKEALTFLNEEVDINETNEQQYINSLESLKDQLEHGEIKMYGSTEDSTYGAGVSHQARLTVTPDRTVLSETGNSQQITVKVSLITKQTVPVTLHYETVSGSAKAEGSGNVTIQPGEMSTQFVVNYYGNNEQRAGKSLFYITCNEVKNALFENGSAGGKNITIPITVEKNDAFVSEHDVAGKVELSYNNLDSHSGSKWKWDGPLWGHREYWTDYTRYKNYVCTLTYADLKPYIDKWSKNVYTLTYVNRPYFDCGGVGSGGDSSHVENIGRNDNLSTNSVWQYTTTSWMSARNWVPNQNLAGGVSSNMHIKEVHEFVSLNGLTIPNGNFYVGQSVPITATFNEFININDSIKLKLVDGTVLVPQETGTIGKSCTFLYQIPEIPSGVLPRIEELSLNGTTSYSGDSLSISNQSGNAFLLNELVKADPSEYMVINKRCKLNYYKDASFENVWCDIDDNLPGKQWVTEVITLNDGPEHIYRDWVASGGVDIQELDLKATKYLQSGEKVQKALEGTPYQAYADDSKYCVKYYTKSMYLSVDGGTHKVPFYIVAQYGDKTEDNELPVALVARYKAKLNIEKQPVTEATEVFMDPNIGSTYDYILGDKLAELVFSQTCKSVEIPKLYQVKNAVFAYPGAATIDYSNENPFLSNWSKLVDNPEDLVTYHIEYDNDLSHITTNNRENPTYVENEHADKKHSSFNIKNEEDEKEKILTLRDKTEEDEEVSITTRLYDMQNPTITNGFRVETDELSFTAKFVDEKFSFVGTKNLIWVSSDESVATVKYPDEFKGKNADNYGADHTAKVEIIPTGKVGNVYFTLYSLNGETEGYTPVEVCRSATLFCEPGKEPYLKMPFASGEMGTISGNQNEKLDISFISNLTVQNAQEADKSFHLGEYSVKDYPTTFRLDVYEVDYKGEPQGTPVYTDMVVSTQAKTVGKISIPEGILSNTSTNTEIKYIAKISADSLKSKVTASGPILTGDLKSAMVGISVMPVAPSLSLDRLDKYSALDETKQSLGYQLDLHGATPISSSFSITDSEGKVVLSQALVDGANKIDWIPEKLTGKLKEAYKVKATVEYQKDEPEVVDSYILYVYNHEAIDILVDSVNGKTVDGKTNLDEVNWDNHNKVKSLISEDGKTITLDGKKLSLNGLSQDVTLSSMISINYGDYVWGQISDQIKWDVKDATKSKRKKYKDDNDTATTLNYKQGGSYANIDSYDYVTYSPSKNFMAVGLDNGKTVITATHASTGMKSSITVNSNTLKDQLYLFKFVPEQKTRLEYKNGEGKQCVVESNDNGELALYEEKGIVSDIHLFSGDDNASYIGTIIRKNIMSGEADVSKLSYYPINNYKLRGVSNVKLVVTDENGAPYANKKLWIRGGVYKNLEYCYSALLGKQRGHLDDGKKDQEFETDKNGNINIYFDSSQFYTLKEETVKDRTLNGDDSITYNIEVKFQLDDDIDEEGKVYEPQIVHVSSCLNENETINDCSVNVQARLASADPDSIMSIMSPVVNTQYYGQCNEKGEMCNGGCVYGYNGAIGINKEYPIAKVETESLFWGFDVDTEEFVYTDRDGVEISYGEFAQKDTDGTFEAYHTNQQGVRFDNQKVKVITYEFADMPVIQTSWILKKNEIEKLVPEDQIVPVYVSYTLGGESQSIKDVPISFSCTTKQKTDPIKQNTESQDKFQFLLDWVSKKLDWVGERFENEVANNPLMDYAADKLSQLINNEGMPLDIELIPTNDPGCYKVVVRLDSAMGGDFVVSDGGFGEVIGSTALGGTYDAHHLLYADTKDMYKTNWTYSKDKLEKRKKEIEKEHQKAEFSRHLFRVAGAQEARLGGYVFFEFRCSDNGQWAFISTGGSLVGGVDADLSTSVNFKVGPVPVNLQVLLTFNGSVDMKFGGDGKLDMEMLDVSAKTDCFTTVDAKIGLDVFGGVQLGCGIIGVKFGIYGKIIPGYNFKDICCWDADTERKELNLINKLGYKATLYGEVGVRWAIKLLCFSYGSDVAILKGNLWNYKYGDYDDIENLWYSRRPNGVELFSVENGLESRSYLEHIDREWAGGSIETGLTDGTYSMNLVQKNAYTFSEPVYNDDGSIIAFLSDSDSSNLEDTLASYAVLENGNYTNKHGISPVTYVTDELNNVTYKRGSDGLLDPIYDEDGKVINQYRKTERTGYGDSSIKIAGTKDFSVATWIRQKSSIEDTITENGSYSDLTQTMNQAEIYASIWTGEKWTEERLTDNSTCDLAPVVSVNGKYAIVAWRNCVGSDTNNPINFNVRDIIQARIYDKDKGTWSDIVTLYNGQTGSVHNLETAIMSDGTAIATYAIKTTANEDSIKDTDVMYTIVSAQGEIIDNTRVTNDNNEDENVQVASVKWNGEEQFILGWYNEAEFGEKDNEENPVVTKDIRLLAINKQGIPSSDFVESIRAAGADIICQNFKFTKPVKDASLEDLSIVWMNTVESDDINVADDQYAQEKKQYVVSAIRFLENNGKVVLSTPVEIAKTKLGNTIDSFSTYGDRENLQTVFQSTNYDMDLDDPSTYEVKYYPKEESEDTETDSSEESKSMEVNEDSQTLEPIEMKNAKDVEDTDKYEKVYIPVGKTSMYTASSKYRLCAISSEEPLFDKDNAQTGFSMPVGFTVQNTGLYDINKLVITMDGKETEFDTKLIPGEVKAFTVYYKVPTEKIHDVTYTIKAYSDKYESRPEDCSGLMKLNIPEVSISDMKIVTEENKARTIQVSLDNAGVIPFEDGGKQIVLELYDVNPEQVEDAKPIDSVTVKKNADLARVDTHSYNYQFTLSEKDMDKLINEHFTKKQLEKAGYEIPSSKLAMYAKASILDENGDEEDEPYTFDNQEYVEIQSLVDKYQSEVTISSRIIKSENSADAIVTVKNNSYVNKTNGNAIACLVNKDGKVISNVKQTYDASKKDKGIICIAPEAVEDIRLHFTSEDILEGNSINDAVAISVNYGNVTLGDISGELDSFSVRGQQISKDIFEANKKNASTEVTTKKVKTNVNGNEEESIIEVHKTTYNISKTLNEKQLKTFVSVMPKNPENNITIKVNGKEVLKGNGAQIIDSKLYASSNTITVTVDGSTFKQMEVTRTQPVKNKKGEVVKDKNGKEKTIEVKERYELNKDGNAIDENGIIVDLEAKDIVKYEFITIQNETIYCAYLVPDLKADDEKLNKNVDLSNCLLILNTNMKSNKQGEETSCKLTWNAVSGAEGYLVYGAKCDTAKKTYEMKRLALLKGNGILSFTQKGLEEKQSYKYLIKAYRTVNGKREIIAISYVARTYTGGKTSVYANPVKIRVDKQTITLKRGKTYKIEAVIDIPKGKKKKKQGPEKRYVTSDKNIATVSSKGKIKAKKKGTCYVYVIAQNGVNKKIKVVVK